MDDLIDILESFNRKERFFLVAQALGNPTFELSTGFREKLAKAVGLDRQGIEIPACAFAAMDYHLDWVAASLELSSKGDTKKPVTNRDKPVEGSPEDIDLLVAFGCEGKHHLIFVEAKAYGSWGNKQLKSKVARLDRIFGTDGKKCNGIVPHFSLMSPNPPQKLSILWLKWMLGGNGGKPHHLEMSLPPKNERRRAERCDEKGNPNANGGHFHCPFG